MEMIKLIPIIIIGGAVILLLIVIIGNWIVAPTVSKGKK